MVKLIFEFGYADIFSRDNLDSKDRQIATVLVLTALDNAQPQLKFHINAGLNNVVNLPLCFARNLLLCITNIYLKKQL